MDAAAPTLHFFCGKPGAGKSTLAVCLQRIARRNVERPEGSHRLTEDDFHHVASYFQAPADDEGFTLSCHAA